ncbi:PAS domain S-box protein [Bacillus sp. 31A1R]|uniref:histidine kinase n=1 Tax=Robertmurraya mangrovi TaxID=3098077 RepID=A0ABU5J343_9BACI|nr:PAS domain S-box protein [Bacillus sp. 31A1R]MDZ5473840.1 PAS domain S-box protein [Bacillus sp. 31A1R]
MQEIIILYNPVLIIAAIILTIMASYTALDLFSMLNSSVENKRSLFIGGTFSMGIGIWIMNFIGMLALDVNGSTTYNIPITILSIIIGICFTGMAFYTVTNRILKNSHLWFGSLFMTCAVLSIHIIGMYGLQMAVNYDPVILIVSSILIFASFLFVFWMLFYSKNFTISNQVWLKPLGALITTGAIVEGHFLLIKAASIFKQEGGAIAPREQESFLIYLVLFVSILILSGLIGSSALISKKLAISDTNLKDIQLALDESSIVAITDPKGIITYVNDKFVEISGYTREELIGQDHRILNSEYHPKEFFKNLWRTIGLGKVWRGEVRNKAKDGSYYWVHTTIVPFLNRKGKPYQYVSIRTDITNRKKAEEHLKETLKEVSDIKFALDQSSIVAFTNARGVITNVNEKFCEISGYSREELIGNTHQLLNSSFHSKQFFIDLWKTISQGEVWKGEIRNKAKDGSFYWVDTTIVPFIAENGKPYQYLAIRNDITERKRTEEFLHRQDKLAAVGQLAAGVAHEIRNPLTSMKGYAEFLLEDETNEQRKEFVEIILDEIERINTIVEDFMVLSKPKAVNLEEKNIIPIIQNVLSLLEFEARKKNVRIHFNASEDIIQIECDEDRLKQVFLNFVKNGIEAMPNGGDISVKVVVNEGQVQVSIQDTGIGIPEEKLKKIGEPFYTTKKEGNGLGLMVSFKIIESHNGKVYIESELNKGTTFNIVLPARTA